MLSPGWPVFQGDALCHASHSNNKAFSKARSEPSHPGDMLVIASLETLLTGAKALDSGPTGGITRGSAKLDSSGPVEYAYRNFTVPGWGQTRSFARPERSGAGREPLPQTMRMELLSM